MVARRIVACLDVREGRVVKGVRFAGHRDAGDPLELALRYRDEGVDELVFYDITASPEARRPVGEAASVANVSYSPAGSLPRKGTKTTRYPSCGSGARFHEPCQAMNAPPRYRSPKASLS